MNFIMSYANARVAALNAYAPGEQPRDMKYIKLNTNESPFPPSPGVLEAVAGEAERFNLYSDPTAKPLTDAAYEVMGISPDRVIFTNGSDELLSFALLAFCDSGRGLAFPSVTYGLYRVLTDMYGIPYREIPVGDDFSVDPADYAGLDKNIMLANPNAPTGLCLSVAGIEDIVRSNPGRVVIIDEAYIAFGGESCVGLTEKYDNLLVIRTFSKSHSLAGARLGMGIGSPCLTESLNKVRYSFNAYSVNRVTMLAGAAAIRDTEYYGANCRKIIAARERTREALTALGFTVTESKANFLFARSDRIGGGELYEELKRRGILIRHFTAPAIADYNRITVGTDGQMDALLSAVADILNGGIRK